MSVSYAGIARIRFYGLARRPLSSYEHPNGFSFMTYLADFIKSDSLGRCGASGKVAEYENASGYQHHDNQ